MFGSYCAGRASDRWNDDGVPTLACLLASIAGGAIYVMADMHRSWVLLLLAEFTMGLGGGTLAVLRAHVSKITTDRDRMSHTTYISTAQFVGLGLMPLAALAINYAFVGQHHRDAHAEALEEHNLLLATATGMMGDALAHYTAASTPEAANTHFLSHYRAGAGGRRNKHPGLENSASHIRPSQHGGRHLLSISSATEASTIGGSVAAAAAIVAPVVIPTGQQQGNDGTTFLARFFNHRTAPALLLIALNLGCMLLYFLFFEAGHQSLEFQSKKAVEAAKKKVEQAVQQARREGREFDADNDVGGQSSAFAGPGAAADPEAKDGANAQGGDVDAPAASMASADMSSSAGKRKPKELIFDLSKLDALNLGGSGGGAGAADAAASSGDDAAAASASSKPSLSIVQVSDTTVIVLKPFASDAPAQAEPRPAAADAAADGKASQRATRVPVPSAVSDADLEMDRRGGVGSGAARGGSSGIAGSWASLVAGATGVASAMVALFKPDSHAERAAAASKGSIQSGSGSSSAGSASASGFDGGQRVRIAAYESGRASHDLDNEGVMWGPFLLTPDRMVLWGSCLFVYLNYTIRGVLATVETVGTPTLARFRHIAPGSPLEVEVSATFFGLLGLLGCVVFFLQWLWQDRIDEPTTLVLGFAVTVVGSGAIVFAPHSEQAFMVGCICIWSFGLPAVQNSVLAALSRILGTRVRRGSASDQRKCERGWESCRSVTR